VTGGPIELRARLDQQRVVAELGCKALSGAPLSELLDDAVRGVSEGLRVELCKVIQVLPSGKQLVLCAAAGWDASAIGTVIDEGEGSQSRFTIRQGQPVVVTDLASETRFRGSRLLIEQGVVSGMTVTIGTADNPWGVLGAHARVSRRFSDDDASFLRSVANVIGAAVAREKAEADLRQRESLYRTLIDVLPDEVCIADMQGRITFVSRKGVELFGLDSPDDAIGTHALDWFAPESASEAATALAECLSGKRLSPRRLRVRRRDGAVWSAEISANVLWGDDGRPAGLVAVVRDATDREEAETALRESEERYRTLAETFPDGIVVGRWGNVLYANASALHILGISRVQDLDGPSLLACVHPDDVSMVASQLEAARLVPGNRPPFELRFVRPDGTHVVAEALVTAVPQRGGTVLQMVFRDITARKDVERERARLQEAVARSQRMDTLGNLAGGVAHDFNNILSVILNYAGFLLDGMPEGDPARADVLEIQAAANRAANLTRQLLAFSSKQRNAPTFVNPNRVVESVSRMIERVIGEHITVDLRLHPGVGVVHLDPSQLEQAIMNLAVNARDAMPGGGKLTIATAPCGPVAQDPLPRADLEGKPLVRISVTDTGSGIPPEVLPRIFEPFFTTKAKGKGTGLGLAVVYGVVRQNGGAVTVESELGSGSTFHLLFPRGEPQEDSPADTIDSSELVGRGETVLLVEDEDGVRKAFRRMLESAGYVVLEARDGQEALEAFTADQRCADIVLTDVVMPRMNGVELGVRLSQIRPDVKVVYCSGYTDDLMDRATLDRRGAVLLHKPVKREELLQTIRLMLDR